MNKTKNSSECAVNQFFEREFLGIALEKQIRHCDSYELLPVFNRYLPVNKPVLEAGSGSGRWVAWLMRNGIEVVGLDWSRKLCENARALIHGSRFESGDMRDMPFNNDEFGSVIALGSLEHIPEGPLRALTDIYRVLRPSGIAIITVPYGGILRKMLMTLFKRPLLVLKSSRLLRRIFGKQGWRGLSLSEARYNTVTEWWPEFKCTENGWHFYQYQFSKKQMRLFFNNAGFEVMEEWVAFHKDGIIFNFGRIAGIYDDDEAKPKLSFIGKFLLKILPARFIGHMLCYIVRKS